MYYIDLNNKDMHLIKFIVIKPTKMYDIKIVRYISKQLIILLKLCLMDSMLLYLLMDLQGQVKHIL